MPGTYAHLTLVNEVKVPSRLESLPGFSDEAIASVLDYFKYCELGAVSPDYPYLAIGNADSASWADAMHYERTGQMIHAGVMHLRGLSSEARRKSFAWLLGYAGHIGADVTIHPVVNLKVGPYEQNKKQHRICEMNQDAYIYRRMNLGRNIGLSEHLDTGVCACGAGDQLDPDIAAIWGAMLRAVHPTHFENSPPDFNLWHERFRQVVDAAEDGNRLMALARHVAAGQGLTYPNHDEIDPQYIRALKVPTGVMDYDEMFDRAADNVGEMWSVIAAGVWRGDDSFRSRIGDWNLDTGEDAAGRLVFWS